MKKILTATIAAAALLGSLYAEDFKVDTYSANAPIYYSDKTTAFSSYDGYIATFWFAQDNNPANLTIVGAGVSMDYYAGIAYGMDAGDRAEYKGFLDWNSYPSDPLDMLSGKEALFSIRLFYAPDLVALYDGNDQSYISLTAMLSGVALTPADWEARWDAAQSGDKELGDFQYHMTPDGTTPLQLSELPNFKDKTYYMTGASIPEPSTWLLLGAGAAFTVIMRRRKK